MTNLTPDQDLVAAYVSNEAGQNYKRLLFVKYVLLDEALRKAGEGCEKVADYLEANLSAIRPLSGDLLVEAGTPFFWMNVVRCRSAILKKRSRLMDYSRHIVMLAFDSFFEYLPDGTAVTLPPVEGSEVMLPRLRVRVPSAGQEVLLRRVDSGTLEFERDGERVSLNLANLGPEYLLPHLVVPNHEQAVVLRVKDPALFEDEYIETISLVNVSAVSLNQKIGRAMEMICAADPELCAQIKSNIAWFFPIITKNPNAIHNSFTAQRLIGGMFLSGGYQFMPLLEAVVHEYHHTELYVLMATREVIGEAKERRYYSPWRDDARPLLGLFHAIHVFAEIYEFYGRARHSPAFADYKDYVAARRDEIRRQLRVALQQIRADELPPLGREIYDFISGRLDSGESEPGNRRALLSPDMVTHLEKWCQQYPELIPDIALPSGFQVPDGAFINERP